MGLASKNIHLVVNQVPSNHFDERPHPPIVDTVIIHGMYNPNSSDPLAPLECKKVLDEHGVSAHYLVDLAGIVWQLVHETQRAWHAGKSEMPAPDLRTGVNAFSIGIELIGFWDQPNFNYTPAQYVSLSHLVHAIAARYPIQNCLGHEHIAPVRKEDPGQSFNWSYLRTLLQALEPSSAAWRWP